MRSTFGFPKIAVLVETSTSWGTDIVRGIAGYSRDCGPWSVFVEPRGITERLRLPRNWHGAGIIARVVTQHLADQIAALGLPCVNVSWSAVQGSNVPRVSSDEATIGRLASEHFVEQGYRHFAYFGLPYQPNYVDNIGPGFVQELAGLGFPCSVYQRGGTALTERSPLSELTGLGQWLCSLPKPVGVLTWDARQGRLVTEACLRAGLLVPEDVGVLVSYNDDLICETATPPLSCVDNAPFRIGYETAALLDRMIGGTPPPSRPILIQPTGVTLRRSTDFATIDDPVVAEAVRFIRRHAGESISVDDVLAAVTVSRRSLEQRFARVLGRSPGAEIRRVHVQRAMTFLSQTDLPIHRIAEASGFNHMEVMVRVFRREVGMTPSGFRWQTRPRLEDEPEAASCGAKHTGKAAPPHAAP